MADERAETYTELLRQKGLVETWLEQVNWPKDPETSHILDHLLLMIDRMETSRDICRYRD